MMRTSYDVLAREAQKCSMSEQQHRRKNKAAGVLFSRSNDMGCLPALLHGSRRPIAPHQPIQNPSGMVLVVFDFFAHVHT